MVLIERTDTKRPQPRGETPSRLIDNQTGRRKYAKRRSRNCCVRAVSVLCPLMVVGPWLRSSDKNPSGSILAAAAIKGTQMPLGAPSGPAPGMVAPRPVGHPRGRIRSHHHQRLARPGGGAVEAGSRGRRRKANCPPGGSFKGSINFVPPTLRGPQTKIFEIFFWRSFPGRFSPPPRWKDRPAGMAASP